MSQKNIKVMEPHNFLENLDKKEIYNTLRMPIEQKSNKIIITQNIAQEINKTNNEIHFIDSKELRLPFFMQDISFDKEKNK